MRKKLVSVLLSSALAITAVPQFVLASGGTYDGIKAMQTAEEVLDELKTDSDSVAAELSLRKEQEDKMVEAVKAFYDSYDLDVKTNAAWNEYISVIYDAEAQTRVKEYMQMRYIAEYKTKFGAKGEELAGKLNALDVAFDTTNKTLSESNDMYSQYKTKVSELYQQYSEEGSLFETPGVLKIVPGIETYDSYVKARLFESTKLLLGMVFSSQGLEVDAADTYTGKSFKYSFEKDFKTADIQKKNLAVFFGSVLVEMTATDDVTAKVKNYIKTDDAAVLTIKNSLSEIFVEDKAAAVNAAYKLMGKLLSDAYAADTAKQGEIVRLFGNGADKKGAVQLAMNAADSDGTVQNLWLNLLIRRFVQMKAGSVDLTTLSASALESSGTIENGSSGSFEVRGLDDFGLSNANLPLNTGYFKVESTEPTVTYSNSEGKFTVAYDVAKTAPYEAVIKIYRGQNALSDVDSFVESYKVSVTPARRPSSNRGSSSSSSIPISIVQPKAGGSIEGATSVKSGASHKYVIKPQPGYAVSKVYVDGAEYTDYTMDGNNAVVTLDNITQAHSITAEFVKLLTEDTHISYIIGYPDGSFKPNGNISREETATIFFRLLTKDAREKYLSSETSFDDVEADRWSVKAIATLAKMNVLKGYEDGSFRPSETITRAEFATIAYRFYNMSYSGADLFEDISDHWAKDYINAIADAKWIEGYENGEYRPERKITRAEAVTIVNRMLSRAVNAENIADGAVDFTDCKTADWYYNAVMEASNSHDYEETRLEDGTEKWTEITENPDWSSYEK